MGLYDDFDMDKSEILFQELNRTIVNIYKVCLEEMGYDLYTTENKIEYHNYLINNPIRIGINGGWDGDFDTSDISNILANVDPTWYKQVGIPTGYKIPPDFLEGIKKASTETGVPVLGYLLLGWCESSWKDSPNNKFGYGGYFGQKNAHGKSAYEQAKLDIVQIWKQAENDNPGFTGLAKYAWHYICHGCGNAGAKTFCSAVNNNILNCGMEGWQKAAEAFATKWIKPKHQESQIKEKRMLVPKAVFIISEIVNKFSNVVGDIGSSLGFRKFSGGKSGIFTGKSTKEKFNMCGCDMSDWNPSTAQSKGLITRISIPCQPGSIEFNKYAAADLIAILNEIKALGWFKCYISSGFRTQISADGASRHQVGLAVDINGGQLGNPWYRLGSKFGIPVPSREPQQGVTAPWSRHPKYSGNMYSGGYDRSKCIWSSDHPVVQIFKSHGWGWGGTYGDVMHFSLDGA